MAITITPDLVKQLAQRCRNHKLTTEQVEAVLTSFNDLHSGDPVGTLRRNTDGAIAHRVDVEGIVMWRVSQPDGSQYNDMAPTLDWEKIG